MDEIFFVDKKGNKISSEEISSHIGLALQIIKQEQNLESEFKSSNEKNASIFLIKEKGYMAASETDIRNFIVYNSLNMVKMTIGNLINHLALHTVERIGNNVLYRLYRR